MKKRLATILLLCVVIVAGVYYFYKPLSIISFKMRGYDSLVTPHFVILYKPENEEYISMVAKVADRTYDIVGKDFDFYPEDKVPIVVFPDRISLQSAFNWPKDENTQGVYYRGIIYIQSPGEWVQETENIDKVFFEKGPMVHEYTHLAVDILTGGNYPRWFTEGVAQYEERRVTGYTLDEDFEIDRDVFYDIDDIMHRFDSLSDVPQAYLAALEMTDFLAGQRGIYEIKKIMTLLKNGNSANGIFLQRATGFLQEGKFQFVTNITNRGGIFEPENSSG